MLVAEVYIKSGMRKDVPKVPVLRLEVSNDETGDEDTGNYNVDVIGARGQRTHRTRVVNFRRSRGPLALVRAVLEVLNP